MEIVNNFSVSFYWSADTLGERFLKRDKRVGRLVYGGGTICSFSRRGLFQVGLQFLAHPGKQGDRRHQTGQRQDRHRNNTHRHTAYQYYCRIHRHEQEQIMIVIDGACDEIIEGKLYHLEEGDVVILHSNTEHGGYISERSCRVIDIFCPPRQDYVAKLEAVKKGSPT